MVNSSSFQEEFQRGHLICQQARIFASNENKLVSNNNRTKSNVTPTGESNSQDGEPTVAKTPKFPWGILCASSDLEYFQSHSRYVQVDISASTADDHRAW